MSIDKIAELAVSISKATDDSHKLTAPLLASKLKKCAESFPNDQTVRMMANVITKLADKQVFITRGEVKKLYNQFYTRNTKCAQLLEEELGTINNLSTPTLYQRTDEESFEVNTSSHADPVLASALESVFDNSKPLKLYGKEVAEKATFAVKKSLEDWNLKASSVTVEDGDKDFLVIKADYDTPKGRTSLLIPVEVRGNKVTESSVFMGNSGLKELNNANIKQYLSTHAGAKLKIRATDILTILNKSASEKKEISDAELALARFKAAKLSKNAEVFSGQVTGIQVDAPATPDVQLPELAEKETFAAKFESPHGSASFTFGTDKVQGGASLITRALAGFGHRSAKIKVSGHDKNTIFYAVAIDNGKVGFTVPVKVAAGKLTQPNVMLHNGSLSAFSADSITKLQVANVSDSKAAAVASPLYGLKPSDLVNEVREAVEAGNTARAEDALNCLKQAGDAKAYVIAFKIFASGLTGEKKEAAPENACKMVVKNSSSQHPVCGHTGLPLHKVYQDEHGNCRPMYRRGMDESYEGAYFMNSKIFG